VDIWEKLSLVCTIRFSDYATNKTKIIVF